MKIKIRYFAALREQRGLSEETVDTNSATPAEVYHELAGAHGLTLDPAVVRAAIGDEFAPMDRPLSDGDEVVFLPPVAGG